HPHPPLSTHFPYTTLFRSVETILEELRVETDLERLALVVDRHRLRRLADIWRLGRESHLSPLEAQPEGSGALRQNADPPNHGEQDRKSTRLNSSHQIISYA